jgi:hypothetical protein
MTSREARTFLAAMFLAVASTIAIAAGPSTTRVGAVLDIPSSIPPRQVRAMTEEAAAIWRPYGVSIDWLSASERPGPDVVPIVVRMPPSSRRPDRRGSASGRRPLGSVLFVDGIPDGVITLATDTVEGTIVAEAWNGRPLTEAPIAVRQEFIGRALGRVLAHELGHYLLAQKGHSRSGLMRASFKGDELVATDRRAFQLQSNELAALDVRLAQLTATAGHPGLEN